jgi:hypothetical protein
MSWLQRYRVRAYFRNSIWLLPTLAMPAAVVAVRALHALDEALGWHAGFQPDTVQSALRTMAASMFTFIVFVSSALLVSV